MGTGYARGRRQAPQARARRREPRPRRGRGAQGRQPLAAGARGARRRRRRLRRVPRTPTTTWSSAPAPARSSPTSCAAPPSRSPTRAASAPWPPCRGSCPARGRSSRPAPSATRPGSPPCGPRRCRALGVEKVMTMTSTYDHRVIQGAESGAFLGEIDRLLAARTASTRTSAPSLGLAAAAAARGRRARRSLAPPPPRRASGRGRRRAAGRRRRRHVAGQGPPQPRPPGRAARPARRAEPPGDPALSPEHVGLTPEIMARIPASLLRVKVPGESFAAALPHLRDGLLRHDRLRDRAPLRPPEAALAARGDRVGPPARAAAAPSAAWRSCERLVEVDAFERFLRRTYLGPEDLLDRGRGRARADHRPGHRADGRRGHRRGRAGHGPPRPPRLHHPRRRAPAESILAEFEGHMAFESGEEDDRARPRAT